MREQAGPLPILILATIFIVVWNMDPFVIEEGNATPIAGQYETLKSTTMTTEGIIQQDDKKQNSAPNRSVFHSGVTNQIQLKK